MSNVPLPIVEPPKVGLIFPAKDLTQKLTEDLARTARADYDTFQLVAESIGIVQYNNPEAVRHYSDKVFSRHVDTLGQSDAAIIAMAVMEFSTGFHQRLLKYGMYQPDGYCPFYFQRMVGQDVLLARIVEPAPVPQPQEKKYHVASLRDRIRGG